MPRHIIVRFTKYRKKFPEGSKGKKKVLKLQRKTDCIRSRSVHRNMADQKRVAGYIQCAEWENYANRNSLSSKAIIQNRRD